ncbi:B12-binding domain-containing radical SAM protein [Candidatus Pacearchaeota archaeon]|nr:B12-binding domain-containing radical SAM protein [Candidatus Pacearchaeota archaeon]
MSVRFLGVNLPFYRLLGSHYNGNNLGISYVVAVLNQNGHDAWIYNADFMDRKEYENLKGLFNKFQDYTEYFKKEDHKIWEEVAQKIVDFKPDFVGYFCYTANVKTVDIISKKVKQRIPFVKQIVGGPHSTLDKGLLAKLKYIDYQIIREGEYVTLDLVNEKDPKYIKGVAYRNKLGFIVHNGDAEVLDCDALPFPERDKFWGLTEEQKKTVDVSYVVTIRGCPYRCNYCASPYSWKRNKTQYRSPESVLSELRYLKKNYWDQQKDYDYSQSANTTTKDKLLIKDNSALYFVDDVFTIDKERVKKILRMMIDEKLDMPFKAEMRTDHLDSEVCKLLKEANCVRAKIGVESGSPRILKQIQKDETREEIIAGCHMLEEAGVPYTAYLMAGFPGETDDDLRQTISLAKSIKANYYSLSILSPYYGTKMYYDLLEQGFPLDKQPYEYFYHQTGDLMVNSKISKELIQEYLSLNELNEEKGYV